MKLSTLVIPALLSVSLAAGEGQDSGLIPISQRRDVSAFGFTDGSKSRTLFEYRGKVVVVDFWTTWCPPCHKSIPELISIQRQEATVPVAVIPVNMDEDGWPVVTVFFAKNRKALEGFRVFRAGLGKNGVHVLGEVTAFPTTFLVDANGKLAWWWSGYGPDLVKDRLNQILTELPAKP